MGTRYNIHGAQTSTNGTDMSRLNGALQLPRGCGKRVEKPVDSSIRDRTETAPTRTLLVLLHYADCSADGPAI